MEVLSRTTVFLNKTALSCSRNRATLASFISGLLYNMGMLLLTTCDFRDVSSPAMFAGNVMNFHEVSTSFPPNLNLLPSLLSIHTCYLCSFDKAFLYLSAHFYSHKFLVHQQSKMMLPFASYLNFPFFLLLFPVYSSTLSMSSFSLLFSHLIPHSSVTK